MQKSMVWTLLFYQPQL